MNRIELLSPAKNTETGKAAINCGADAVYIGPSKFGARASAGNNLNEIEDLVNYAHKYYARVYATVNTVLYDDELEDAEKLIKRLHDIGTDAVIIQDMAIMEMSLPPIPVFASTQANNYSVERIKFLEHAGIQRVILARELSLNQIIEIKNSTSLELETFIHGALCVSLSGQCYLSEAICGRSANRGVCSQPCRASYDLTDSSGNVIEKDKHILSLKDLNLSSHISGLIDAGITSFKIEGRLKDIEYVKNITAFYRKKIDDVISGKQGYEKSSAGSINVEFMPDPEKTFNRGYSSYFLTSPSKSLSTYYTAKSIGEYLGTVNKVSEKYFEINSGKKISNGDGICFVDSGGKFTGTNVNKAESNKIFPSSTKGLKKGIKIYRNFDKRFNDEVIKSGASRIIEAYINLTDNEKGITLTAGDENGNKISYCPDIGKDLARDELSMQRIIEKQFKKSGTSIFKINDVKINFKNSYFIPVAKINEIRRTALSLLEKERIKNFPAMRDKRTKNNYPFPEKSLDYTFNVTNKKAREFYLKHGVLEIMPGFESDPDRNGKTVMKTKYCIKRELNICPLNNSSVSGLKEPLYLINNNKKYKLRFDCKECFMKIIY